MTNFDVSYMKMALDAARKAVEQNEVPVGAVLVHDPTKEVLSVQHNLIIARNDPTAHAEILAIREACSIKKNHRLSECSLYTTLEPCPMCAQAIAFARIDNLYFSVEDIKSGGVYNGPRIFNQPSCNHTPVVYDSILEKESKAILQNFFLERR